MMLKRSALIGGWTMKGISYLSEEFVFVLEGRMPLRRILCKRTAWEDYVLGRLFWKCHGG